MKVCNILNEANGGKSELHKELLKVLKNQEEAERVYAIVKGTDFIKIFGDWVGNYKGESTEKVGDTYPKGEPKLYRKEKTNQYYFILPDKTKYFINVRGLRANFSPKDIRDITGYFLYKYVQESKSMSLNEFEKNESNSSKISRVIDKAIEDYKIQTGLNETYDDEIRDEFYRKISIVENHKDEFRSELIFAIQSLGEEVREVAEEEKGGGLNIVESITVNPKTSATINTKILLSQILDNKKEDIPSDIDLYQMPDGTWEIDKGDETVADGIASRKEAVKEAWKLSDTKENKISIATTEYLNTPSFLPLSEVWETLAPLLSDIVTTGSGTEIISSYEKMRLKLVERKGIHPWMENLLDKLDYLNKNDRNKLYEFVQAFSKTKNNLLVNTYDSKTNKYKTINATSTNSRENQILESWGINFKNKFLPNNTGRLNKENRFLLSTISDEISSVISEFNDNLKEAGKSYDLRLLAFEKANNQLAQKINKLGMSDVIPLDLQNLNLINGGEDKKIQTLNDTARGLQYTIQYSLSLSTFIQDGDFVNPFKQESAIKDIAYAQGLRKVDIAESNILANNNKNYYAYSNPTYISNKINEWIEDPSELQKMSNELYNTNSRWIKWLTGTEIKRNDKERNRVREQRLSKLKSAIANSFKSEGKNDGVDNVRISYEDQLHDDISKILGSKIKGRKSYFPSIVAADKSRRIVFEGFEMFDSKITEKEGKIYIHPSSVDVLLSYFVDEYNRMKKVKRELQELNESELIAHYHTGNMNGKKSQLFPEFNFDSTNEEFKHLRDLLYDKDGFPLSDDSNLGLNETQEAVLRSAIEKSLIDRVKETKSELEGLTAFDADIKKAYKGSLTALAGDYLMNGIISNVEYTKMFSGDPAYYKDLSDLIKRIPATYTDGLQLALENEDNMRFNIAVVEGVEVSSKYYEKIYDSLDDKSIARSYVVNNKGKGGVNTTDAQAWITPNRWKFLKERLGQWTPMHDVVFDLMKNGKEITKQQHLKILAQPLKGVYFEIKNGVPTYLKYSQAVLIPSLIKGTLMENLYNKMVTNPETGKPYLENESHLEIHEVITRDGVKVGHKATTRINKEGTSEMLEDFQLNVMELNNKGWKLQQDLPIKTMKDTDLGSQIQKNIFEGLVLNGDYTFNGKPIKGIDLIKEIHKAVKDLSDIGKEGLTERFGIVNDKITNTEAIYEALIDEFKSRGRGENVVSALEKETPLDAIPQIRGRVDSVLMSIFNKALTKIATNGGSFIQVSPFGLETITTDNNLDNKSEVKVKPLSYDEAVRFEELSAIRESIEFDPTYIVLNQMPKITPASAKKETGQSIGTSKDINPSWLSKDGVSVERAAEIIVQNNQNLNEDEVRDIIIDLLPMTKSEVMNSYFNEQEFKELSKRSLIDEEVTYTPVNKSDIKIISKNYDGKGLQPPRKDANGNVLPGQAMIPYSLAKKILRKNNIDISQLTQEELYNIFSDDARGLISYRIPNQGMSSNDTLEIVGILPDGVGDSIIMYDAVPAKTGSDFDIDKMFVIAPNLVFNKKTGKLEVLNDNNIEFFEKIDTDEGAYELNKRLSQNRLYELYQSVLKSPLTYDNMMRSIDSSFLKDDILKLFPAEDFKNISFFSPINQLKTKSDYMAGKFGIGITANNLVDHAENLALNIFIKANLGVVPAIDEMTKIDFNKEGTSIASVLSAFLNAYVDIAKDPYITRANHNDITANVTFMLIRAGVDIKLINRFIGQPILKEYVKLVRRKNSITEKALVLNKTKTLESGLKVEVQEYFLKPEDYLISKYNLNKVKSKDVVKKFSELSEKQLEKTIEIGGNQYIDEVVLKTFLEYNKHADALSSAVLAAKTEKGAGGSPVDLMVNKDSIDKVLSDQFVVNFNTKIEGTGQGAYRDNGMKWVSTVLEKSNLLLSGKEKYHEAVQNVFSELKGENYVTDKKLAKKISNGLYTYMLSGHDIFKDNGKDFNKLFVDLPKEIQKLKDEGSDNFLIKELEMSFRGGYNFIGINNKNKPVDYQNDIYRAWLDLYENESTKQMAIDLVKYSFTQSGFQPNLNQFYTYIPHEILKDLDLNYYIGGLFQKVKNYAHGANFVEQFIRHNAEDKEVVPRVYPNNNKNNTVVGFKLNQSEGDKVPRSNYVAVELDSGEIALYYHVGRNKSKEDMYIRTYKLGYSAGKNKIVEYTDLSGAEDDQKVRRSIVPQNNFSDNKEFVKSISKLANQFKSETIALNEKTTEDGKDIEDIKTESYDLGVDNPNSRVPKVENSDYGIQTTFDFSSQDAIGEEEMSEPLKLSKEQLEAIIKNNLSKIKKDQNIKDPDCKKKNNK